MRAAGGKMRRRLRSLEPGFLGQYFPGLANSAVVEAWQEHGPQQVFRISPLLTRFVALWSLLAFFATDFPVRAALALGAHRVVVVLGHQRERVEAHLQRWLGVRADYLQA
jgi:hypothetical protein